MKKYILSVVAIMIGVSAMAQDTLLIHPSNWPSNYYKASYWQEYDSIGYFSYYAVPYDIDQWAWKMYTDDTLTVYGMAACMTTHKDLHPEEYYEGSYYYLVDLETLKDTTYAFVYDYLRLYEADEDSLRPVGEDLKCISTPPLCRTI